jgi:hypothetical protein
MSMDLDKALQLPSLAKELVHLKLDQSNISRSSLAKLLETYGLNEDEFLELLSDKEIVELIQATNARARELGSRAGYVFRMETMISNLAEHMYQRIMSGEPGMSEVIKAFVAMARTAGLDELPGASKAGGGVTTNIQINVPELANTKVGHINGV